MMTVVTIIRYTRVAKKDERTNVSCVKISWTKPDNDAVIMSEKPVVHPCEEDEEQAYRAKNARH